MDKFIEGIVFAVIGLVVMLAGLTVVKSIPAAVIGGLFLAAGIIWVITEIINKNKNKD